MFFVSALIVSRWGMVRWGRNSYSGLAEVSSFFSQDFSWSNKHYTFWHVFITSYRLAIAVSDFCLLESYKNLGFPLSTATFTTNSHADNNFYKYIYLFQILYSTKLFLWKYCLEMFLYSSLVSMFSNKKPWSTQKKINRKKHEKIIELHVVHTWRHM